MEVSSKFPVQNIKKGFQRAKSVVGMSNLSVSVRRPCHKNCYYNTFQGRKIKVQDNLQSFAENHRR